MAGRSSYTESDKAEIFVRLTANDGNVKRTSRETEVPEQTIRNWKKDWDANPPEITDVVASAVHDYIVKVEEVRDLALATLRAKIVAGEVDAKTLITTFGVCEDKVSRARGINAARVDHVVKLPSIEDIRASLGAAVQVAIEAAGVRQDEIVDAEVVEVQPALPKAVIEAE